MRAPNRDSVVPVSRRQVLKLFPQAGAAFVLGCWLDGCGLMDESGPGWEPPLNPTAWLKVNHDGLVEIVVARSEMGQGVRTALPAIIAEELDADWSKVRVIAALANRRLYGDQTTGGSLSIRTSWARLRRVGATARTMLVAAAAEQWSVSHRDCGTAEGYVIHPDGKQRLNYAGLVDAATRQKVPRKVKLKDESEFQLIGQPLKRLDTPAKVRGKAQFGIDVRVPGMAYAAMVRQPRPGARLVSFDGDAAKEVPGVIDVYEANGAVAVLARSTWAAFSARQAVAVEWDTSSAEALSTESLNEYFQTQSRSPAVVLHERGSVETALAESEQRIEADYHCPFLAHAPMEPMNCTASVQGDACEIWAPTQVPNEVREMAARRLGIPMDRVTVHTTLLGGGFGRRLVFDYAIEAVEVARKADRPVQVVWSREDDIQHGHFRPGSLQRMTAGLSANKSISALKHTVVAPSILDQLGRLDGDYDGEVQSEMATLYAPPHLRIDYVKANTSIPVSWMRSVYNMDAAFAEESFLDEIAVATQQDALELRRTLLRNAEEVTVGSEKWNPARMIHTLERVYEAATWGKQPAHLHQGLACHGSYFSYAAAVVEVSTQGEKVRIERIIVAVDCGRVVNPAILEAQIEGGVLFTLSSVLNGVITLRNGAVEQDNFHNYPILRMADAPRVEVHVIETTNPPTGAGELPVPVVAPALANALFAATGERQRSLPLRGMA